MLKKTAGACVFLVMLLTALLPVRAEIIEQVLVKVNGDILTLTEFEKRQVAALQARSEELGKLSPNDPRIQRLIAESAPELILSAVDELLLLQRAREHGWSLTDQRYQDILKEIRASNNLQDDATFKKALAAEGLTEAELRSSLERDMLIRQVRQVDVTEKISVTEDEVRAFYNANTREFTSPAEVTVREILIAIPTSDRGVNVAEDDEARATAEATRKRLAAGEPFARLAGEVSASPSKANGGLIGPILLGDLTTELQAIITALQVGDISDVKRTSRGYQIIKLESRSETKVRTLEDARGDVSRRVAEQKTRGETLKYLEKLRSQANIVWRHEELKKAYEKALTDRLQAASNQVPTKP